MKIIFCLHHFLPEYVAGTEVYTYNLALNLKAKGVETVVLIPNFKNTETIEYEYKDIRIIKYAENSTEDREMIMGKKKPEGIEEFKKIIKNEQPDIVHFNELAPGFGISIFHVEAVYDLKIKVVSTLHLASYSCFTGSLMYKDVKHCNGLIEVGKCTDCGFHSKGIKGVKNALLGTMAKATYRIGVDTTAWNSSLGTALGFPFVIKKIKDDLMKLARMNDKIIVLTNWYKHILEKNGVPSEKLEYIPQGLIADTVVKAAPDKEPSLPLKLIFIGRISAFKGVHLLIDAVKQIPSEEVILDIYGPDADDVYAADCRRNSSLMSNVHWKGSIPSEEVMRLLPGYDLLCLPSTFSEMSPLVIQEAFAARVPVLASNVYGNVEQIQEGINGWLFQFKQSGDLLSKLKYLINEPSLVYEAKKKMKPVRMFADVAEQYYQLYEDILQVTD